MRPPAVIATAATAIAVSALLAAGGSAALPDVKGIPSGSIAVIDSPVGSGEAKPGPLPAPGRKAAVNQPFGVEFAPDGTLAVCSVGHHRIVRWNPETDEVTAWVGNGTKGNAGDNGPAADAVCNEPYEVRFDPAGNLWFVDMVAAVVRRVDAKTGIITTVAGSGQAGFDGDGGPATAAKLRQPHSIALDAAGNLFIADLGNHRIRRVDAKTGIITTVAGTGEKSGPAEGPAAGKPMLGPRALHIVGNVMAVALREGHAVWEYDLAKGTLRFVAGSGKAGAADGAGKAASFNGPKGIVITADGTWLVMDTENHAVRRVDPKTGAVTTVSGNGPKARGFAGDGGSASDKAVKMDRPHGICTGPDGVSIWVGDSNNHRVRVITAPKAK